MAPKNKFDINRTPGVKPGLKTGDIISDLAQIETNDNPDTVKQAMLAFDSFIRNGPYFAVQTVGRYIKTTGVILSDEEDKPDVPGGGGSKLQRMKFVASIDVNKDMCNKFGIMHGACTAYILDSITTSVLVCLEGPPRVSVSLNISFFKPAPLGTRLKVVGYSTSVGKSLAHTRGEIWDLDKSVLLSSCTHTQVDPKQ